VQEVQVVQFFNVERSSFWTLRMAHMLVLTLYCHTSLWRVSAYCPPYSSTSLSGFTVTMVEYSLFDGLLTELTKTWYQVEVLTLKTHISSRVVLIMLTP